MAEETLPGLRLFNRGKVRDIYDLGDKLLLVATDRISAFDVVLPTLIPDKGKILTALSVYWFDVMKDIVPHHLISTNVDEFPAVCYPHGAKLEGRSMLVFRMERLPKYRCRMRYSATERLDGSLASGSTHLYALHQSSRRRP
jgi:phosphoribosylaminoimidazole-succinocarboxamide synthase